MTTKLNLLQAAAGKSERTHEPSIKRKPQPHENDFGGVMCQALSEKAPKTNPANKPFHAKTTDRRKVESSEDEVPKLASEDGENKKVVTREDSLELNSLLALLAQTTPANPVPIASQTTQESGGAGAIATGEEVNGNDSDDFSGNAALNLADPSQAEVGSEAESKVLADAPSKPTEKADSSLQKVAEPVAAKGLDLPVADQLQTKLPPEMISRSVNSHDGKAPAKQEQRMKFSEKKNKIAGQAQQKLPRSMGLSSDVGEVSGAKVVPSVFEQTREIVREVLVTSSISPVGHTGVENDYSTKTIVPTNDVAAKVERLESLISSEVVSFRKTGANELGVILKLDSRTEIFLQLTQNEGQIHASIRCERGDLTGLDTHWKQLQESLARHNVQLQSQDEGKSSFNSTNQQSPQNFAQARQEQNREQSFPESSDDRSFVEPRARNLSPVKPVKKLNPQRWESWA